MHDTLPSPMDAILVRQPIFNPKGLVWGYEVQTRGEAPLDLGRMTDPEAALRRLTADILSQPLTESAPVLMLRLEPGVVATGVPPILACERTVLLVDEALEPSAEMIHTLRGLRLEGYRLALDDYDDRAGAEEFFRLADMVCCELPIHGENSLAPPPGKAKAQSKLILARGILHHAQFAEAKALGYSLFQGDFFKSPDIRPDIPLSSHAASRLRLFQLIESEDMELEPLAQAISADVAISYRLLTLLNSAAFGLGRKVSSIREALLLAGWTAVKNWLRVVILADMRAPDKTAELAMLAAQRGRFLENLARVVPGAPAPDRLFLLGLFSLLDALLDRPMSEILGHLPLDQDLKSVLSGQDISPANWLAIAQSFEAGVWDRLDQEVAAIGVEPFVAAKLYYDALAWASEIFQPMG